MRSDWISDPVVWIIALPALAVSGLLAQMVLSLFRCCGSFKIQGKPVQLKWWMIPATATVCGLLWSLTILYVLLSDS